MTEAVAPRTPMSQLRPLRFLSEERLTRLAADGDQRAFSEIYRRHHQEIYRYCLTILRSPEDARDALQSTMMNALRSLPGERRQIPLKPWLYRVAHNEAVTVLRQRRPTAPLEEARAPQSPSANQQAEQKTRLRELVADLSSLPERQRGALVMRELSGLSYSEIGSAFETSSTAAKQTVYEARAALHEIASGRDMDCETVRQALSANDGRVLRGRKLRSHLRHCASCRDFRSASRQRRSDLAALAPPLPAAVAAGLLQSVVGSNAGGLGGGVLGLLGGVGGKTVATSGALKAGAAVIATAAIGVGTADVTGVIDTPFVGRSGSGAKHSSPNQGVPQPVSPGGSTTAGQAAGSGAEAAPAGKSKGKTDSKVAAGHGKGASKGHGALKGAGAPSKSHGSSNAHAAAAPKGTGGHAFGKSKAHTHAPQRPAQAQGQPAAPAHQAAAGAKSGGGSKRAGGAPKAAAGGSDPPAIPTAPGNSAGKGKS